MPVAHSLLQVREELTALAPRLSVEQLWTKLGGGAPVAFHVKHLAGSLDRLLTYARGETLDDRQRAALDAEESAGATRETPDRLFTAAVETIDRALAQVRATPVETLR